MQSNYSIALSSDKNYFKYAKLLIDSIKENTSRKIHFYIFTFDNIILDEQEKQDITVKSLNKNVFQSFKLNHHLKVETYIRFLIPNLLFRLNIGSFIYFDVDMLVIDNIDELLDKTHDVSSLMMVDSYDLHLAKKINVDKYYNAGLILINTKWWHQNNIEERLFRLAQDKKIQAIISYSDQCILNYELSQDIEELDYQYNAHLPTTQNNNIKIIHFAGSRKPWNISYKGAFKQIYRERMKNKKIRITRSPKDYILIIKDIWKSFF